MKKIFFADDDSSFRKVIIFFFDKLAYEYDIAEDGLEASNILSSGRNKYDLILLDCNMPGKSGLELAAFLKENNLYRNTPVVIFSADSSIESSSEAGITGVIKKPCPPSYYMNEIKKYIGE